LVQAALLHLLQVVLLETMVNPLFLAQLLLQADLQMLTRKHLVLAQKVEQAEQEKLVEPVAALTEPAAVVAREQMALETMVVPEHLQQLQVPLLNTAAAALVEMDLQELLQVVELLVITPQLHLMQRELELQTLAAVVLVQFQDMAVQVELASYSFVTVNRQELLYLLLMQIAEQVLTLESISKPAHPKHFQIAQTSHVQVMNLQVGTPQQMDREPILH
jgi:hypothetical protein